MFQIDDLRNNPVELFARLRHKNWGSVLQKDNSNIYNLFVSHLLLQFILFVFLSS